MRLILLILAACLPHLAAAGTVNASRTLPAGTIITFVCTGLTFKFFLQRQRLREAQALGLTHPSLSSASTADSKESV